MPDTECSRCTQIPTVCSIAVLLWALMHRTCIAEAAVLLPEAFLRKIFEGIDKLEFAPDLEVCTPSAWQPCLPHVMT